MRRLKVNDFKYGMRNILNLTVFGLLLASSCSQVVELPMNSASQELVVLAEMEVGADNPTISLQTTFNDQLEPLKFVSSLIVDVFVNDDIEAKNYRPDPNDKSNWEAPAELTIEENTNYRLYIDASEIGIEEIAEAETKSPISGSIQIDELSSPETVTSSTGDVSIFDLDFSVSTNSEQHEYYHLTPYVLLSNGDKMFLTVEDVDISENAVIRLDHRHGMLIDESLVSETNVISLSLSLSQEIENIDLSTDEMFFELRTVPRDYFLYHRSLSLQSQSTSSPFTLPTLTYTNISSGYGLFTAFTSKLVSVAIN